MTDINFTKTKLYVAEASCQSSRYNATWSCIWLLGLLYFQVTATRLFINLRVCLSKIGRSCIPSYYYECVSHVSFIYPRLFRYYINAISGLHFVEDSASVMYSLWQQNKVQDISASDV
jgi:hypothetical protein